MAKFNIASSGYSVSEVDEYIDALTLKYETKLSEQRDRLLALKNENVMLESSLADSKIREDEMSKALVFAVEKSEQIENGSKKVYDLEVRRIRLVYSKWKDILDLLGKDALSGIGNGKAAYFLQEFNEDIDKILRQTQEFESRQTEDESVKENLRENSSNYIKNLLNRMDYLVEESNIKSKPVRKKAAQKVGKDMEDSTKRENARLLNINRRFNSIYSKLGVATGSEILEDTISDDNAYFRNIAGNQPDDDAFDMDAILTPKEDLAEIMKAFDELN